MTATNREELEEELAAASDFGSVAGTTQGANKSVEATVTGDEDPDGDEELEEVELWGLASVLERPADPDSSGSCELVFLRRGDEIVGIGTKDRRWQVTLEKGEVVVRAFGSSAATIHLKPGGEAVLTATDIKLGGPAVSDFVALASKVDAHLTTLQNAHDVHSHATAPDGPVSPPSVLVGALTGVGSSIVGAD